MVRIVFVWRRERDLNPRYLTVYRFSRPAHSTTLTSLLVGTIAWLGFALANHQLMLCSSSSHKLTLSVNWCEASAFGVFLSTSNFEQSPFFVSLKHRIIIVSIQTLLQATSSLLLLFFAPFSLYHKNGNFASLLTYSSKNNFLHISLKSLSFASISAISENILYYKIC